jgi:hypothetical protein
MGQSTSPPMSIRYETGNPTRDSGVVHKTVGKPCWRRRAIFRRALIRCERECRRPALRSLQSAHDAVASGRSRLRLSRCFVGRQKRHQLLLGPHQDERLQGLRLVRECLSIASFGQATARLCRIRRNRLRSKLRSRTKRQQDTTRLPHRVLTSQDTVLSCAELSSYLIVTGASAREMLASPRP